MLFMFSQMIFGSLFTLSIKWVQNRRREDMITVGMINYIVAALAMLPEFLKSQNGDLDVWATACGANMGITYFVAFFFVIYAVKTVGAASTVVVSVLSIVVPILYGIFVWGEDPNGWQVLGVCLAIGSLLLISSSRLKPSEAGSKPPLPDPDNDESRAAESDTERMVAMPRLAAGWKTPVVLLAFFLLCGNSRVAQETLNHVSGPGERPTFLFVAFLVASIPSIFVLVYRRMLVKPIEVLFGVGLGMANLLQSHFILKALESYPGFIVFPVTSSGALILTTVLATQLMGERLSGRAYLGIVLATVALFLLYWLP